MKSTKPYLIRALYEWCVDQGFTPHIQVHVGPAARVPKDYVRDGQIVFNIGMDATHQLELSNEDITFQARFNGKAFPVRVPTAYVIAIYARENGQGMAFEVEDFDEMTVAEASDVEASAVESSAVEASDLAVKSADDDQDEPPPAGGRPALRRIK